MGFWQGMNEGLTYVLDRKAAREADEKAYAFEREKYQRTLLENRREAYLELAAKRAEREAAQNAQLSMGIGLGLTETGAILLQNSGQLGFFLDQYDKNKKVDPEYVKDLNVFLEDKLKEAGSDTFSRAMVLGVSTERDTKDPEQSVLAMVEAIYGATSSEELDEISKGLYSSDTSTSIPPFKLDFSYVSGAEETETKNIRSEIATKLQPYFTDAFIQNPETGEVTISQNADRSVAELFSLAEERARDMAFGPTRSMTPTNAAAQVAKNIQTAVTTAKTVGAKDLVINFDAVMVDPVTFSQNFTPIETTPPPGITPEQEVEQVGDALGNSFFNIIEEEEKKRVK
jgi:hypothetical protein